jgi:hypothetical protein
MRLANLDGRTTLVVPGADNREAGMAGGHDAG